MNAFGAWETCGCLKLDVDIPYPLPFILFFSLLWRLIGLDRLFVGT